MFHCLTILAVYCFSFAVVVHQGIQPVVGFSSVSEPQTRIIRSNCHGRFRKNLRDDHVQGVSYEKGEDCEGDSNFCSILSSDDSMPRNVLFLPSIGAFLLFVAVLFMDIPPSYANDGNDIYSTCEPSINMLSPTISSSTVDYQDILQKATKKALGGGKAGASAAVVQVSLLMWLRTAMNYQYRYGGDLISSLKKLYSEGGIPRFYQGLPFAIIQGPLTRFGDTAANVGVLALLESFPETSSLPLPVKTACGSVAAGIWRIFLMPIDTSKTSMQVEGFEGINRLKEKVSEVGPSALYQGSLASAAATTVGHFPWFLTYNFLSDVLPSISREESIVLFLVRSATCGLVASCVSDICSNSLRVIKTTKQTGALSSDNSGERNDSKISYREVVSLILEDDGVVGLFTRGLSTRLLTNAIQGAAFSVLWKYFQVVQ